MTIDEVRTQFQTAIEEGSSYFNMVSHLDDSRYCRWPGQAEDGRKYSANLKKQAFPWEGASDIRNFYVDDLINDDVDIMRTADENCFMQALGTNSTNDSIAKAVTDVLAYVQRTWLAEELNRERTLAAQWRQHYGSSVLGVDWLYEIDSEQKTVTMQDLMGIAQQDQQFGAVLQYLMQLAQSGQQPNQQDLAAGMQEFRQYFPQADPMQAFGQLMQTGQFSFNQPYPRVDRPTVTAYRTYQDVFFPRSTCDIQKSPWVVRRDVLNRPQVEDKAKIEGWDPKFTKFLLNSGGTGGSVLYQMALDTSSRYGDRIQTDELRDMYEVFYGFYRGVDQQSGNRQTQVCIFHPGTTVIGQQLPTPYSHGKYPFIVCVRELRSRSILESRGIGDIADTAQQEIKTQRDSRNDRTSISTIPPLLVPLGRGKQQYKLGPASQLGILRPGELAWLNPPPMDNSSFDTENSIRRETANYFGKNLEGVDPNKVQRRTQRLVDAWLAEQREVMVQVFDLCLQFMDPQQWAEVSGMPELQQMPQDRETIQKNTRLTLEFDARDLNQEYLQAKLELINTVLVPTDAAGVLDRAAITQYACRAIDPALGNRVIRPSGEVTAKEVADEQNCMAQIQTGVTPPLYEANSGQNPQLRLQVIQSTLQAPDFQAFIKQNPVAQQRLQDRIKAFQFAIQQQQNAQIGRVGVQPSPITAVTGGVQQAPPS